LKFSDGTRIKKNPVSENSGPFLPRDPFDVGHWIHRFDRRNTEQHQGLAPALDQDRLTSPDYLRTNRRQMGFRFENSNRFHPVNQPDGWFRIKAGFLITENGGYV
jgi:hypothetical protein